MYDVYTVYFAGKLPNIRCLHTILIDPVNNMMRALFLLW